MMTFIVMARTADGQATEVSRYDNCSAAWHSAAVVRKVLPATWVVRSPSLKAERLAREVTK